MKLNLTEHQYKIIQSKLQYIEILENISFKISILLEEEERKPDMEWDFTKVKKDLDLSSAWVRTKEDVLEYITELKDKIKKLPQNVKDKILKYALYSFIGIITLNQINNFLEKPLQQSAQTEKKVFKTIEQPRIRKSSEKLIDHLKWEEGSVTNKGEPVLVAYNLGDGAYTIGYGHAIFRGENEGYDFLPKYNKIKPGKTNITKKNAEKLLKDDIEIAENIINKILNDWEKEGIKPKLTQGMYDAMVSMAFNMGPGIRKKEFLQAIKKGNFEEAKELILQTSSGLFDDYPGLKSRREKEAKMFA